LVRSTIARFIAVRALSALVVCFLLLVLTFAMVRLIPGDPARIVAGARASPQEIAAIRVRLGLDHSLFQQFTSYFVNVIHFHLGNSFLSGAPVREIIAQRFPRTAELAIPSVVASFLIAIPVGLVVAGVTREGKRPVVASAFTSITGLFASLPAFLVATFLAYLLAVHWALLPVGGYTGWTSLILPCVSITTFPTALLVRVVRREAADVLLTDYVRTARSKEMSGWRLYFRHVLPNAISASLSVTGVTFAQTLGGAVIVENVFSYPGIGTELVDSVIGHDYPVTQAIILLLGVLTVVINACVDIALRVIDPKLALSA
jgi:peptide/nickel transport system permease protein